MLQILARQLAQALGMDFGFVGRIDGEQGDAVQTLAIAHRGYIIENGMVAMQGPAADLARDPELRKNYLGL